jgi:hypothetical protein
VASDIGKPDRGVRIHHHAGGEHRDAVEHSNQRLVDATAQISGDQVPRDPGGDGQENRRDTHPMETRAPWIRQLRKSRPRSSPPNGCARLELASSARVALGEPEPLRSVFPEFRA